ncbi:MAG TPA: GNAT family N-acetyltransferase [Actinomycetota bacterium]|nr:GNAT family N-acetyltransferase [Actinomycetota bacterium]
MSGTVSHMDILVRPCQAQDEDEVLRLLRASLGGGPAGNRSAEFFRWKHVENPFGPSFMLVAETDERIVGLRAFMRWRFLAGERELRAVRAVDTATHPDFQGRGIFRRLTLDALDQLRDQTDLIFNTPNDKSLPGYLKMGWESVGDLPIRVRVARPVRFARGVRSWRSLETAAAGETLTHARTAEQALDEPGIPGLLAEAERRDAIATVRGLAYLRWRYARAPLLDYRGVTARDGMSVRGLGLFRVRPRGALTEATVSEVLVRRGDVGGARAVLQAIRRSAGVDHLTCSFPQGSTALRAARVAGYLRAPGGVRLVTNALGHRLEPDPRRLPSWALSVGDVEVF